MQRFASLPLAAVLFCGGAALAQPLSLSPYPYPAPVQMAPARAMPMQPAPMAPATPPMVLAAPPMVMVQPQAPGRLGGGFIEFLFGDRQPAQASMPPPSFAQPYPGQPQQPVYVNTAPDQAPYSHQPPDPRYLRQEVAYDGKEMPGTVVIDTPNRFLYLVQEGGRAIRYGVGVGRPGFTWSGAHKISAKKEWPDWVPPDEMLERQPYLPHFVAGGPNNPLGARALYLGSTLYRIHGSNEPWTIGQMVSSGCIRMRNEDVIDLYERVKIGTKVVVI